MHSITPFKAGSTQQILKPNGQNLDPVKLPKVEERRHSQTLPRKPKRNQQDESGGPTNELQATLANRCAWESR